MKMCYFIMSRSALFLMSDHHNLKTKENQMKCVIINQNKISQQLMYKSKNWILREEIFGKFGKNLSYAGKMRLLRYKYSQDKKVLGSLAITRILMLINIKLMIQIGLYYISGKPNNTNSFNLTLRIRKQRIH